MGAGAVGRAYLFPAGFPVETFGGMFVPFALALLCFFLFKKKEGEACLALPSFFCFKIATYIVSDE